MLLRRRDILRNLSLALLASLAVQASAEDPPAAWPPGWVSAYERFEKFNAAREKYNPATHLEFSSSGAIYHTVPFAAGERRNLFFTFFQTGRQNLESALANATLSQNPAVFPPGRYASCVKVSGPNGYQHLYPIVWFESSRSPGRNASELRFKMVPPPEPAEDFWPNERLLKFLDFTVFPNFGLPQVMLSNDRVTPSISLKVTNAGMVVREKLDDSSEKLLRWRVYHNGRLVERGAAEGVLRYDAARHGAGSYLILLGADGPTGFLPVSNYLHFPLFPEKGGGCAVLPTVTNVRRFPDFLLDTMSSTDLGKEILEQLPAKQKNTFYASETIYDLQSVETLGNADKDALMYLWKNWGYNVNLLKHDPQSELNRIPLIP